MNAKAMQEIQTWWTVSESARYIGMSRQSLYAHLEDGRLRGVPTRAGWLCDPQAVQEYAEKWQRRRGRERAAK